MFHAAGRKTLPIAVNKDAYDHRCSRLPPSSARYVRSVPKADKSAMQQEVAISHLVGTRVGGAISPAEARSRKVHETGVSDMDAAFQRVPYLLTELHKF